MQISFHLHKKKTYLIILNFCQLILLIIIMVMLRYHLFWNCNIILMLLFIKNTDIILIFCAIELSHICVKYIEIMRFDRLDGEDEYIT